MCSVATALAVARQTRLKYSVGLRRSLRTANATHDGLRASAGSHKHAEKAIDAAVAAASRIATILAHRPDRGSCAVR